MHAVLLSFGDPAWENSFIRIKNQIEPFNQVKNVELFDIKKLNEETLFFKNNPTLLDKRPYGYGAWIWKTYILQNAFIKHPNADFFIYSDSGNEFNFNKNSCARFEEYIDIAGDKNAFGFMSQYREDQMSHCSVANNIYPGPKDTKIINAGFLIFKNNQISKDIINEWQYLCEVNDYYNVEVNKPKCCDYYINNLSDQAVLSPILKKNNIYGIPDEADWIQCSPESVDVNLEKYPVFNARNKTEESVVNRCLKYFDSVKCRHSSTGEDCNSLLVLR
jgi:hypothetical protein